MCFFLFSVEPKSELPRDELAVYAARYVSRCYLLLPRLHCVFSLCIYVYRLFEATGVVEEVVVNKFVDKYCHAGADTSTSSKKKSSTTREQLDREPAQPGEQVAAKAPAKGDEEGAWILGNVLEYDAKGQMYAVQDEDDVSRVMTLAFSDVRRLEDSSAHLRRGDKVYAVFPETTSFYPAVVAKNPKPPSSPSGMWDVVVRFNDDEDDTGKSPARRVPARFVLLKRDVDQNYESEEEDA